MPTHDMVIDDVRPSVARSNLSTAFQALATAFADNTAPTTKYAYQLYIDTSAATDKLQIRNSDNDDYLPLFDLRFRAYNVFLYANTYSEGTEIVDELVTPTQSGVLQTATEAQVIAGTDTIGHLNSPKNIVTAIQTHDQPSVGFNGGYSSVTRFLNTLYRNTDEFPHFYIVTCNSNTTPAELKLFVRENQFLVAGDLRIHITSIANQKCCMSFLIPPNYYYKFEGNHGIYSAFLLT